MVARTPPKMSHVNPAATRYSTVGNSRFRYFSTLNSIAATVVASSRIMKPQKIEKCMIPG